MAGVPLAAGALTVIAAIGVGVAAVGGAGIRSAQTSVVADAAALAAADTAAGFATGAPCERAAEVAGRAGMSVVACDLDGLVATVEIAASAGVFRVHARARAGPPP